MMWILASKILCCGSNRQIHTDYQVLWRRRDGSATLSRGELTDPCLDRLSLLFWAHYVEDDPHLPYFRRLLKTKERVLLIT